MRAALRSLSLAAAAFGLAAAGGCGGGPAPSAAHAATLAEAPRARAVRLTAVADADALLAAVATLHRAVSRLPGDSASRATARLAFEAARHAYKRVEFVAEVYTPFAAEQINGPPLLDVEHHEGDRPVRLPDGFQVIEEYLYPDVGVADSAEAAALAREVAVLRGHAVRVRQLFAANVWNDATVFDATRLEVARVATLGIGGFDSPVAGRSAPEGAAAFRALRAALRAYAPPADGARGHASLPHAAWRRADSALAGAAAYLDANPDAERLDRLTFIAEHANPAAHAIAALRDALAVRPLTGYRGWRGDAASVYQAGAFDADAFASPFAEPARTREERAARVALGRRLFFDPRLSDGSRTCASCHDPARAFTDGRARSASLGAGGAGQAQLRNAPTLLNAALQPTQFADGRAAYLEDQIADVVSNRNEMHGALDAAARSMRGRPGDARAFAAAFGAAGDSAAVSEARIRQAIAAYVRSLVSLNSPFDRAARGDAAAMTASARRGFDVFMGKGKCGTCHFPPLFTGTVPPGYTKAENEVLGVPSTVAWRRARVDSDSGRMAVTRAELHRHAFKTPTVRNAAVTAPYMHNGVYRTLEDVVEFYDRGGGAGIGIDLPNQTLPREPLRLTRREKRDLVAFMHALTDTTAR